MFFGKKKQLTLTELLRLDDKGLSLTNNTLARVTRDMFKARRITPEWLSKRIDVWVKYKCSEHDKERSSEKSNIQRAVVNPNATLKHSMRIWKIIGIKKLVITYEATWDDDVVTYHQDTIDNMDDIEGMRGVMQHKPERKPPVTIKPFSKPAKEKEDFDMDYGIDVDDDDDY